MMSTSPYWLPVVSSSVDSARCKRRITFGHWPFPSSLFEGGGLACQVMSKIFCETYQ